LSSQLNVPFIDLDRTVIDRHLSKYISRSYAKRYALVPVAQFGRTLNGVVSQRLVRKICEVCKVDDRPNAKLAGEFFGGKLPDFSFYRSTGCEHCGYTGYQGRMLVADLWVLDDRDRLLIAQDASLETVQESAERTTISMAQDAHDRLLAGRTTLEELVRVLPYTAVIEHRRRYGA
jgi:type II secretory ATPase GspE/PulE/Tfp pilus assembly ATPase PilB-like protein